MGKREDDIRAYIRTNYPNDVNKIRQSMNFAQLTRLVQDLSGGIPKVLGDVPDELRDTRIFGSIQPATTETTTTTTTSGGGSTSLTIGTVSTTASGGNAEASITDDKLNLVLPRGSAGAQGNTGSAGATGTAATIAIGTVSTGAAGSGASVSNTGSTSAAVFDFSIPRGDSGNDGSAATVAVGTTTTLSAGASATVSNTGSTSAATLNFGIPQGAQGIQGNQGIQGTAGTNGSDGAAATIAVGSVSTGAAGTPATVANAGTSSAAVLNFGIPQGAQGTQGIQGIQGIQGAAGQGVPTGGTAGQVLSKIDGTDYNTQWSAAGAGYTDAQAVAAVEAEPTLDLTGKTKFGQVPEDLTAVAATYSIGANTVVVPDGSIFALGDKLSTTVDPIVDSGGSAAQPDKGILITAISGNTLTMTKSFGTAITTNTVFKRERGKCLNLPSSPYLYANTVGSDEIELLADRTGSNSAMLRINTDTGYLRLGPQNSSFCHFYTDRAYFYFNRPIQMDGGSFYAYNDDLEIKTDDSGSGQPTRILIDAGVDACRIGLGNGFTQANLPQTECHVAGTIRQSATTNAIVYADANGDLAPLTIGANLTLTGNSLAAAGGGGGGSADFIGLTDTPASYSGQASKIPAVNFLENGLDFVDITGQLGMLIYDSNGQVGSANKTKLAFDATFAVQDTSSSTATVSVVGGGGGGGGTNLLPPVVGTITGGGTIAAGVNRVMMIAGGDFEQPITLSAPTTTTFDFSFNNMTNERAIMDCGSGRKFSYLNQESGMSEGQFIMIHAGVCASFSFFTNPLSDGVNRWVCMSVSPNGGRGFDFI